MNSSNLSPLPQPLNKILYGPPGTGKTYRTAQLAVEICNGNAPEDRKELMKQYESLRKEGRISFVTFHQSYGYEDFVEGLRPEVVNGQVTYQVRKGVFRQACDAARRYKLSTPELAKNPLENRSFYKISLGPSNTAEGKEVLQRSLAENCIVLGWGKDIDFSECNNETECIAKISHENPTLEKPESNARFISRFKNEVKIGDIVIISQGNTDFCAIGEITGEYEFNNPPQARYYQTRKVQWLYVSDANRSVSEIYDRDFTQASLYKLDISGINFHALYSLIDPTTERTETTEKKHVLIIDEINRANISKVFGELITLLEKDKREGELNAITLQLPYSPLEEFSVPPNLFLIGTMNTADRSIALLDTALRRRFEFEELQPNYSELSSINIPGLDMPALLKAMNERIEYLYDRDHTIGHAYFIGIKSQIELANVFRRKVIPLLQEYFYEDWSKIQTVLNDEKNAAFIKAVKKAPTGIAPDNDDYEIRVRYQVNDAPFPIHAFQNIYTQEK